MKKFIKYVFGFIVITTFYSVSVILLSKHEVSVTKTVIEPDVSTILLNRQKPIELPFGGRELVPKYRFVALYGSPTYKSLGILGERDVFGSITRAKELATTYQAYSSETIIPTFEIITTVASAGPTENDDYSQELDPESIKPWINAAKENGVYIVLDLQPGRTSFLQQAKQYESLLLEPHVGLALDPEWRLLTSEARHLKKVGSVHIEEVNQTSEWLADLVKTHDLPQKIFMVHQFKSSMIIDRIKMKTDRSELAYIIHMDGHGSLSQKVDTWNKTKVDLPINVTMGWKNFYDEDRPTPTPEQTMQQFPMPTFISFQ